MYDETFDSFNWLFETFLKAHSGKQPKTFYTDQDFAMGKAVESVFAEAWHGLCSFHIMQNAIKHLPQIAVKHVPPRKDEDSNILSDFSACMFEYDSKRKEVKTNSSKRIKMWYDSKRKARKKTKGKTAVQGTVSMKQEAVEEVGNNGGEAQAQVATNSASRDKEMVSEGYMAVSTFTQLLTGPNNDDLNIEDIF